MPEFQMEGTCEPAFRALDYFTQGYIEALFFTDTGSEEGALGDAGFSELAPETLTCIVADCITFQTANAAALDAAYATDAYNEMQAGRDFWFTRNRHGVGYWDRTELDGLACQKQLTDAAHACGEVGTTLGDDSRVYLS